MSRRLSAAHPTRSRRPPLPALAVLAGVIVADNVDTCSHQSHSSSLGSRRSRRLRFPSRASALAQLPRRQESMVRAIRRSPLTLENRPYHSQVRRCPSSRPPTVRCGTVNPPVSAGSAHVDAPTVRTLVVINLGQPRRV